VVDAAECGAFVFFFGRRAGSDTNCFLRGDGGDVGALDFSGCFGVGGGLEEGVLLCSC
jgi:hypothetical protein